MCGAVSVWYNKINTNSDGGEIKLWARFTASISETGWCWKSGCTRRFFEGVAAEDETDLCRLLPRDELEARLKKHRDTYITLEDFKWIKAHGLNTVRIPVPHFIFGDDPAFCDPYVPCIEYLDKAFDWAEETGLQILIDLHHRAGQPERL